MLFIDFMDDITEMHEISLVELIFFKIARTREKTSFVFNMYFQTQTPDVVVRIIYKEYPWGNNSTNKTVFKYREDLRKLDPYKWDVVRNFSHQIDVAIDKKDVIWTHSHFVVVL